MRQIHNKILLAFFLACSLAAIDFVVGRLIIPKQFNEFRCANAYYHHGLLPRRHETSMWGGVEYPVYTNSLGLRDGSAREVQLTPAKRRILFVGDSFTEGIGIPFDSTFAGIVGNKTDAEVLNSGVVGYSPRLYYLKTKYLIEEVGLKFNEAVILIDISDILNELEYEDFAPGKLDLASNPSSGASRVLTKYSALYYLVSSRLKSRNTTEQQDKLAGITPCWGTAHPEIYNGRIEASWTLDKDIYERFGKKGLALADKNMTMLIDLLKRNKIKANIVVYPWPAQIYSFDRDSLQVRYWREFSSRHNIAFLDLFPQFIDENRYSGPEEVYSNFFIRGDIHWNTAGHDLVANSIMQFLGTNNAIDNKNGLLKTGQ